jgi:multisubunit Na+/H+ antiporter MnhF subunit
VVALICLVAVVTSHHVTAVAMITALIVWSAALAFSRWRGYVTRRTQGVGGIAVIATVAAVGWALYVATETVKYLGSPLLVTFKDMLRIIAGEPGRTLFDAVAGGPPAWERVVSIATTLVIVLALPLGLAILWRRYRRRPTALLLGIVAMAYPVVLVFRFTSSTGLEAASRANTFVFVGVAFVVALVLVRLVQRLTSSRAVIASPVAFGVVTLIFVGGLALGTSAWSRLPGPFLVGGETRAISPQGTAAAAWTFVELGAGNRVAADRSNRLLLGSYGDQRVVFDGRDLISLWPLYDAPTMDGVAEDTVRRGDIRFVLVDRRLSTALPMVGFYFDQGEVPPGHQSAIPADSLAKFDRDDRVDRIYDSGAIQIYDTSRLGR